MGWAIVGLALIQAVFMLLVVNKVVRTAAETNARWEDLVERLVESRTIPTGEMAIVHHRERMERLKAQNVKPFESANDVPEVQTMVYGE